MPAAPGDDKPPITQTDAEPEGAAPDVTSLDAERRQRLSSTWPLRWRRPLIGALTLALVVSVAASLFAHSTSDPVGAIGSLLGIAPASPTLLPTSTVAPANAFAAVHGVPWGVLTISGQRMAADETVGGYFQLTPGPHAVEYQAEEFPTLRCVVSVPPSANDTCPLANAADISDAPQVYANVRVLDLLATPAQLLPSQRATLETAIAQTLAALGGATTIARGERYLDANAKPQRASGPLRFSLAPTLASPSESLSHPDQIGQTPCGPVCASWVDPQTAQTSVSQSNWRLVVMVKPAHTVSDASGSLITYGQSDARFVAPLALLATRTATGWQIGLDSLRQSGDDQTQTLFCPPTLLQSLQADSGAVSGFLTLLPHNPADGCVIAVLQPNAATGATSASALIIERFGVMQAANAQAARLYPRLPLADATAQAIAQQTYAVGVYSQQ
jgi:hypothetical protein